MSGRAGELVGPTDLCTAGFCFVLVVCYVVVHSGGL